MDGNPGRCVEVWDILQTWPPQCLCSTVPRYGGFAMRQADESREAILRDRDSWMPGPRKRGGQDCGRPIGVGQEGRSSCLKRTMGADRGGHWTEEANKGQIYLR